MIKLFQQVKEKDDQTNKRKEIYIPPEHHKLLMT